MSLFDPVRWAFKQNEKEWCVVKLNDYYMVVPTHEVIDVRHIVMKDLTRKDAKMWVRMMR